MQTLSAANRLRSQVLNTPHTILLTHYGSQDEVIRIVPLDSIVLNLDRGPDQEKWEEIQRQMVLESRRDRPIPRPAKVSNGPKEEWSIGNEDVPVVELLSLIKEKEIKEEVKEVSSQSKYEMKDGLAEQLLECDKCGKKFTLKQKQILLMHKARFHKEVK